ncbi:acyl-CoA carboxylase subunit beta [Frisingicoccus sp.]|uniref:acyl-CoA carboxylase subunit beta n=1 Tax=Frisingicoccus sp. TaxID=1918627 RepID=UPI003AB8FE11
MSMATQLSARERIAGLFDDHSFVEIGAMVHARNTDFNMAEQDTPADGVLTGYGTIDGKLAYVYSQDIRVMGGSVGEMHAKKIVRMYDMALKMGAPVIGLIDCAGMRLQEATDALDAFGAIYYKQTMASGMIPQITGVFGTCGGGMSLVPALSDFTFAVAGKGEIFVNSPDALDENRSEICNTAACDFRSKVSGDVDGVCGDDSEVLLKIRQLVSILPSNNKEDAFCMSEASDDLNRENPSLGMTKDTAFILRDISDHGAYFEVKPDYAGEMVTAFITLNGNTVGAVANREEVLGEDGTVAERYEPVLTVAGIRKAESFIRFCDAFSIPVLTLVNVAGFKATVEEEQYMASASAKLTYAYASATVPKVSVVIGKAFGSAYLCMGSRHIGADLMYAWPEANIGMMAAESAVKIIYSDEIGKAEDQKAFIQEKSAAYDALQNSPESAAARGYVDTVILPAATRKRVIAAFDMLATKREPGMDKKHGTV